MKKICILTLAVFLVHLYCGNFLFGQTRLILNGAKINITNNAFLVIENPSTDAITRNSGHIITEGEDNNIKWHTGTNTGTYIVPLGYTDTSYLPLNFTKSAGTGDGYFLFSTYHTGWQNSLNNPSGITDLLTAGNDNSNFILDRFWKIDAVDFTVKPALSNLVFHYPEYEFNVSNNTITEIQLGTYRWNDISSTWLDFTPSETIDITANTLTVANVGSTDLYKWWILVDKASVLPSHIYNFRATKAADDVKLSWSIDYDLEITGFEIERSNNGRNFSKISTETRRPVNTYNDYQLIDNNPYNGRNFYRIKQTRIDNSKEYTEVRMVDMGRIADVRVYPNPSHNRSVMLDMKSMPSGEYSVSLVDLNGKTCYSKLVNNAGGLVNINFGQGLNAGIYFIKISGAGSSQLIRILLM